MGHGVLVAGAAVERFDGLPVTESEALPLLLAAGFRAGPKRGVLRA